MPRASVFDLVQSLEVLEQVEGEFRDMLRPSLLRAHADIVHAAGRVMVRIADAHATCLDRTVAERRPDFSTKEADGVDRVAQAATRLCQLCRSAMGRRPQACDLAADPEAALRTFLPVCDIIRAYAEFERARLHPLLVDVAPVDPRALRWVMGTGDAEAA